MSSSQPNNLRLTSAYSDGALLGAMHCTDARLVIAADGLYKRDVFRECRTRQLRRGFG
jgi:hypothetical protein